MSRKKLATELLKFDGGIEMFRRKKDVLDGIVRRVQKHRDGEYAIFEAYLGINPENGRPVRLYARMKSELERQVTEYYARLNSGGEVSVMLTRVQAVDAKQAFDLLAQHGVNTTLLELAKAAVENAKNGIDVNFTLLKDAYAMFMEAKSNKSRDYIKTLKSHLGGFVNDIGGDRPIPDVTASMIKESLYRRVYRKDDMKTWTTYDKHVGDLKTFFSWCASPAQGILRENPGEAVEKIGGHWVQPEYMKPDDVKRLFGSLASNGMHVDLADSVLSFFCGMRQIEIDRVREGDGAVKINLEDNVIRVVKCKGFTRGVFPRTFTIPEQARAWIDSFDFMQSVMERNANFRRHLKKVADDIGVYLPENAGRKTFITMHDAVHHDPNRLSAIVGNTEDVRRQNYNGLASEREGREFFSIMPT